MKNKLTVKHFVTLPPMWKLICQKSSFHFGLIFLHLGLLFSQKCFLFVRIQYLRCIYLQGFVCILKNKFTVKHFVTLPPMWKLICRKSSFDFGLIFSHLALLLLQKHFFGVKIKYLMSTYVWFVLSKWVELPSGWVVPGSCVKIFFGFWSVNFCWGAV